MRYFKHRSAVAVTALFAACSDPMEPRGRLAVAPTLASVAGSGCQSVTFHVSAPQGGPFDSPGTVTGDLAGTAHFVFEPGSLKFAGHHVFVSGTATWDVVGSGSLGHLVFTTDIDNRNYLSDTRPSPLSVFENIGTHRVRSGVTRANLHYRGTFDGMTMIAEHDYRGVICP
jgi:hypothetical protein